MFDPLEFAVAWASRVTGVRCGTYIYDDMPDPAVVVTRSGGTVDFPHDAPNFAFTVYASTDDEAESLAYQLAIAARYGQCQPSDPHLNAVGAPSLYSYGRRNGQYIWETDIPMNFRLLD